MKQLTLALLVVIVAARVAIAEDKSFPGLSRVMDPAAYARTGVQNLSPEQRAELDAFLRDYVSGREKDAAAVAASQAVDAAVKERKVRPPEVTESRIVGEFKNYGPRALFRLANGQTWKPTDDQYGAHSPIQNPNVVIYRDFFGYKMFVEGAGIIRVKRVN